MRCPLWLLAFILVPLPVSASDVSVRVTDGRVDLSATAAPIADVLERLSRQTGMKVVYEGPAPRQLVTVSLHGRSPTEAVLGLLEGQGLNYILIGDASGDRVQTLMMAGAAPVTASRSAAPTPSGNRMISPPPAAGPDPDEPVEEAVEEEEEPEPAQAIQPPPGLQQLIPGAGPNAAVPPIAGLPQTQNQNMPPGFSIPGMPGFPGAASGPTPFGLPTVQPFPPQPGAPKTPQAGQDDHPPP
jgi:hypothetical protein